jgi:hypothetical protein
VAGVAGHPGAAEFTALGIVVVPVQLAVAALGLWLVGALR